MRFERFWRTLTTEYSSSKELRTLKQKKNFEAKYYGGLVYVTPNSTEKERPVNQEQFLQVWNTAKKFLKHEQFKVGNYSQVTYNASYILALMKHVLGEGEIQ